MRKKLENNNFENIISRRQMLRTSIFATAGAIISAPAIVTAKSKALIVPVTESMIVIPAGWGFLRKMFDFKNWFWRGVGAFLREALNVQQYPQIVPYNQDQSNSGYQVPQSSPILEIPQQNFTYPLTNNYPTSYQEVIACNQDGQQNIFALPPAGLIALKEALDSVQKQCPCISTKTLRGLLVPQREIRQLKPKTLNGQYYGEYQTQYGTLELSQTPTQDSQSELYFRLKNEWGPKGISPVITANYRMGVEYTENDVNIK